MPSQKENGFGKGSGKGGLRHFSKPYVDSDLVFKILEENSEILQNLKNYEHTSKCNAPDPKGLIQTLPLWKGLLKLEGPGEIHCQPLRTALISLLAQHAELNQSQNSGQVWANMRVERINTILFHVRKVGRGNLAPCAARLTRQEFQDLSEGLKLLDGNILGKTREKANALEKAKALEKAAALEGSAALEKADALEKAAALGKAELGKRNLKKNDSEVSMGSKGYPTMFKDTPKSDKKTNLPVATPSISRRRPGNIAAPLENGELQDALGFGSKGLKKPAAALGKAARQGIALEKAKKPAAVAKKKSLKRKANSLEKERKPWWKILKTIAIKGNPRAYLRGTTEKMAPCI